MLYIETIRTLRLAVLHRVFIDSVPVNRRNRQRMSVVRERLAFVFFGVKDGT